MLHRSKSRDRRSAGSSGFMNPDQMNNYLTDLRTNRPARPTGARPPPTTFKSVRHSISNYEMSSAHSTNTVSSSKVSTERQQSLERNATPHLSGSDSIRNGNSVSNHTLGRPLVRGTGNDVPVEDDLNYQETCGARWMEKQEARSLRMALQEVDLKNTDKDEDEQRIFNAAQKEAGELVWKHHNGETAPYQNPSLRKASMEQAVRTGGEEQPLFSHLRKGSHARSLSRGAREGIVVQKRSGSRSTSGSSTGSGRSARQVSDGSVKSLDSVEEHTNTSTRKRSVQFAVPPQVVEEMPAPIQSTTAYGAETTKHSGVLNSMHFRNPFARARISRSSLGSISRPSSCPPTQPRAERVEIQRNPPSQSRNAAYTVNQPSSPSTGDAVEEEIKTKDGWEIRGEDIRKATSMSLKDRSSKLPSPSMVSDSPERPIVSFQRDWKPREIHMEQQKPTSTISRDASKPYSPHLKNSNARNSLPPMPFKIHEDHVKNETPSHSRSPIGTEPTSRKTGIANHRSHKSNPVLPTINIPDEPPRSQRQPQMPAISVTEFASSSRPISKPPVPAKSPLRQSSGSTPPLPTINFPDEPPARSNTRPPVPIINLPDEPSARPVIPTISIETPTINVKTTPSPPTISINNTPTILISGTSSSSHTKTRPLPKPTPKGRQFRPGPPPSPQSGNSTVGRGATVLCHTCAFPIAGRIVTAAGCRFHPGCFRCHHCSEALECVAFYPEPEAMYAERKERVERRINGEIVDGSSAEEDGDDGMRFFCHLDFHEFFSPRCKSCKTPIEGDVVVACGAEWHAGHFFCAQCGDPFEASTPYVEKDGYAWCVNCHTHRYSTKCKKCRKPVIDTVVKALGAEWHEDCFCCTECQSRFTDGRYFLRQDSDDPYCPACEERRLKA